MKFRIRDLRWLTFVAAVFGCWFVDHRSVETTKAALEAERRAMEEKAKASLEFARGIAKEIAENTTIASGRFTIRPKTMAPSQCDTTSGR